METSDDVLAELQDPTLEQFRITNPPEIAGVLNRLRAVNAIATLYFDGQPGSSTTSIIEASARTGRFTFDVDREPAHNAAIAGTRRLAWRAQHDGVRIDFLSAPPRPVEIDGKPAFVAPLPEFLIRLQRRNAFRASTPVAQPLVAVLDPEGRGNQSIRARVTDISLLGMSLLVEAASAQLVAGQRVARCTLALPGYGEIRCGLEVRYILSGGADAANQRRCGAQFLALAAADGVLVSRYIQDLQRVQSRIRH